MNYAWSPYAQPPPPPPPQAPLNFDGTVQQSPAHPAYSTLASESFDAAVAPLPSGGEVHNAYALHRQPYYGQQFAEWAYPYMAPPMLYAPLVPPQAYVGNQEPASTSKEASTDGGATGTAVTPDRISCGTLVPTSDVDARDPGPYYFPGSVYVMGSGQYYVPNRYPQSAPPKLAWSQVAQYGDSRTAMGQWYHPPTPSRTCSTCVHKSRCAPVQDENATHTKKRNPKSRRKLGFESATQDEAKSSGKGNASHHSHQEMTTGNDLPDHGTRGQTADTASFQHVVNASDTLGLAGISFQNNQVIITREAAQAIDPSLVPQGLATSTDQQLELDAVHDIDELYRIIFPDAYPENEEAQGATAPDTAQCVVNEGGTVTTETDVSENFHQVGNVSLNDLTTYGSLVTGNLDASDGSHLDYHFTTDDNNSIPRLSITDKEEASNLEENGDKKREIQLIGDDAHQSELETAVKTLLVLDSGRGDSTEQHALPTNTTVAGNELLQTGEDPTDSIILRQFETPPIADEYDKFFDFPFSFEELLQEVEISSSHAGHVGQLHQQDVDGAATVSDSKSFSRTVEREATVGDTADDTASEEKTAVEEANVGPTDDGSAFFAIPREASAGCIQSREDIHAVDENLNGCSVPDATVEVEITTTADYTDVKNPCTEDNDSFSFEAESNKMPSSGNTGELNILGNNTDPFILMADFTGDSDKIDNDGIRKDAVAGTESTVTKSVRDVAVQVSTCCCKLKTDRESTTAGKSQKKKSTKINGFSPDILKSVGLILDEENGKNWSYEKNEAFIRRIAEMTAHQSNESPSVTIPNDISARNFQQNVQQDENVCSENDTNSARKVKAPKRLQNSKCLGSTKKSEKTAEKHGGETKKKTPSTKSKPKSENSKTVKKKAVKTEERKVIKIPQSRPKVTADLTFDDERTQQISKRDYHEQISVDEVTSSDSTLKNDANRPETVTGGSQREPEEREAEIKTESQENMTVHDSKDELSSNDRNVEPTEVLEKELQVPNNALEDEDEYREIESVEDIDYPRSTRYNLRRLANKPTYNIS